MENTSSKTPSILKKTVVAVVATTAMLTGAFVTGPTEAEALECYTSGGYTGCSHSIGCVTIWSVTDPGGETIASGKSWDC